MMSRLLSVCLVLLVVTLLAGCGSKSNKATPSGSGPSSENSKSESSPRENSKSESPAVSTVELQKGPKGEAISKVEKGKEQASGFKTKSGKFVRHGPYVLFYDQIGGKKKWEGECYNGQWHGKLTGWYEDGSLWFERWYDKGKPVGTHKGYDAGKVVWQLTFDDGKPRLNEVDCHCVVCQIGFLYGTSSWTWIHPNGEDTTVFRFKDTIRKDIPDTEFLWLLGQPQQRRDVLPNKYEQDWVYRCKDGTVTCRLVAGKVPLIMTQTIVNGRRKF